MTARTLIGDVLEDIGYLGVGDTLSPEDASKAFRRLNSWVDFMGIQRLLKYFVVRTTKTLAANTQSYTIGIGGDINIVRPTDIERAGLVLDINADPETEIEIDVLTPQQYDAILQKTLASPYARGVYFDRNWVAGLARVYLWPVPTIGTTALALYTLQALTQFVNLDTDYTFPPGWEEFFLTNFPLRIARSFGQSITQQQQDLATEARMRLKIENDQPEETSLDDRLPGRSRTSLYNWRTDQGAGS